MHLNQLKGISKSVKKQKRQVFIKLIGKIPLFIGPETYLNLPPQIYFSRSLRKRKITEIKAKSF